MSQLAAATAESCLLPLFAEPKQQYQLTQLRSSFTSSILVGRLHYEELLRYIQVDSYSVSM